MNTINPTVTFPEYISLIGDKATAKMFTVSVRTAANWRLMIRMPSGKKSMEIVAKTNGRVTMDSIFGEHVVPVVFHRGRRLKRHSEPVVAV